MSRETDILVVGAGVAGLACARDLVSAGRQVILLEKSRGVGGRCATRRVEGQAVDHGLAFLHGSDPAFLEDLGRADPDGALDGWPVRIRGHGRACQPQAFGKGERRTAFASGVNVFPSHLAAGLDIVQETPVAALEREGTQFRAITEDGARYRAEAVVLALPAPQAIPLLERLVDCEPAIRPGRALLGMAGSMSCLTVLAGYDLDEQEPDWDVWYPEESAVLQLISHDSAKRRDPARRVLVYQAPPAWSRGRIGDDPADWSVDVLAEAGSLLGPWAAKPAWSQAHRWRFARVDPGTGFTEPVMFRLPGGPALGLAGEAFSPGGGVEAAWRSGRRLAQVLLER